MTRLWIKLLIFINLFIDLLVATPPEPCPAAGGVYAACSKKVVYLIDTSTDLTSVEIQNSFDFMRSKIIPGTAWGTLLQLAFCSYGTGLLQSQPFEDTISKACDRLNTVEQAWIQLGSDTVSLLTSLQVVDLFYKDADMIVLFSASKNANDIQQAGQFVSQNMSNKVFTVIAQDKANFSKFPAQVVHEIESLAKPPSNLVSCLIKNACGQSFACNINAAADPPLYYPTTAAAPTPSQVAPAASYCSCDISKVWLDVIFLFDASRATGQDNLDNMWGFVASILDFYNVQRTNYTGTNYYTQVGIVTYGNQATVLNPLGSINTADIDNIYSLTYNGDEESNLEQGLKTANSQLQGSAHRPNAQRVIVVMTMEYNSGGADAPQKTAATIKNDGVIIMAYDYDPQHGGAPTQGLSDIATIGYYFTSDVNGTMDDVNQAMCDANCFCPANYKPYSSMVNNMRQLPTDGCYIDTGITSNYRLAVNRCVSYNNGTLPTDFDANKTAFLSQLTAGQAFWLALAYDNGWKWLDDRPLLATDYQPWASGIPPDGSAPQTNVYFTSQSKWQSTDPRNLFIVVCQSFACDPTNYCPQPQ